MQLNHYETWIWWSTFSPMDSTSSKFSDYLATLKEGEMEFFGEVESNGMYIVPDYELTEDFKKWLTRKRQEDKTIAEQIKKRKKEI